MAHYPFRSALPSGFVLLMNVRKCALELPYDEQSMLKNAAFLPPPPIFLGEFSTRWQTLSPENELTA